jgi:hypothetical protein
MALFQRKDFRPVRGWFNLSSRNYEILSKILFVVLLAGCVCGELRAEEPRVLVYTRNHVTNGKGYVHDNIAASVAMKGNYPGVIFGDRFPLAWCQEFDGGRQFYTALGHKIEYYSDPQFQRHVLGGVVWVMRKTPAP